MSSGISFSSYLCLLYRLCSQALLMLAGKPTVAPHLPPTHLLLVACVLIPGRISPFALIPGTGSHCSGLCHMSILYHLAKIQYSVWFRSSANSCSGGDGSSLSNYKNDWKKGDPSRENWGAIINKSYQDCIWLMV